jgi:hypothetical protein
MSLLLSAIARATDRGRSPAERIDVRSEIFSHRLNPGALGRFRIDGDGDTSLTRYEVYTLSSGRLVPWPGAG